MQYQHGTYRKGTAAGMTEGTSGSANIEKFPPAELAALRGELLRTSIDSWQATHLLAEFLEARGYGVDALLVPDVLHCLESTHCSPERIQHQLERLALVM